MVSKTVKLLRVAGASFLITIMLWLMVSFIDIVGHNLTDQSYLNWNAFCMLVEAGEAKNNIT